MGMKKIAIPLLAATLLASLTLAAWAQEKVTSDKTVQDQYLAVATAKVKAELMVRKGTELSDLNKSGWIQATQAIDTALTRIRTAQYKALQTEQNRPENERDQNALNDLQQRLQLTEQQAQQTQKDIQLLQGVDYNDANTILNNTRNVFQTLSAMESNWKDGKMDLSLLQTNYDQITKTAGAAVAQAQKVIATVQALQKTWEQQLEAVNNPTTKPAPK